MAERQARLAEWIAAVLALPSCRGHPVHTSGHARPARNAAFCPAGSAGGNLPPAAHPPAQAVADFLRDRGDAAGPPAAAAATPRLGRALYDYAPPAAASDPAVVGQNYYALTVR